MYRRTTGLDIGRDRGEPMQEKQLRFRGLFLATVMLTFSFAGCLGAFDSATQPRATLEAYPLLIQEGEMVTFDARESDAIEGIITAYRWDFGDGETSETVTGFTSMFTTSLEHTPFLLKSRTIKEGLTKRLQSSSSTGLQRLF